ncbi:MAG: hypothetical protein M3Y80_11790 [Verrucomicrobiota bacterium]|nr:hypothetical protein [Verrucomicrobiota bacterium]
MPNVDFIEAARKLPSLQDPNERIQRSLFKIAAWTIALLVVLIGGGIFGYGQFRHWQERRLVAEGNALVNEGNMKRASIDGRRILQINPESAAGARIMARISEAAGSHSAVEWRRRVIELLPTSAPDAIALARAALRFDDKGSLDLALSKLSPEAKTTADYHALAAEIAGRAGDKAASERNLREAVQLAPENKDYLLQLATLQLASASTDAREQANQALTALQREPAQRREATRQLVLDSFRRHKSDRAVALGRQLDAFPEKTFSDRLLLLQALQDTADPGTTPLLQELQAAAATNVEQAAELISWFNANQMPAAAISWATQLPAETRSHKALITALADAYMAAGDWTGMQALVQTGNWSGIEYLRSALAARAARELRNEPESSAQWTQAVQKVSALPKQALMLAEIVARWGWKNEAIELYWIASKDPAAGDAALRSLYAYFANLGATQDLYRVLLHQQELHPEDRGVQNNVAQLALLLHLNVDRAQRIARENFQQEPKNPVYVSTYAFALFSAGDTKKALEVMRTLSPEQLQDPAVAAYYGVMLAAAGEQQQAAQFLDLAEKAGLLPEERALVEKARRTSPRP